MLDIDDGDGPLPELNPQPQLVGTFAGFPIYVDPDLAPGWVQFKNADGDIIGMINEVGEIHVAQRRQP